MMVFRGNTQRWMANTIRYPLLVFTVSHDFTLKSDVRSRDLGIVNGPPRPLGAFSYFYAEWRIKFWKEL